MSRRFSSPAPTVSAFVLAVAAILVCSGARADERAAANAVMAQAIVQIQVWNGAHREGCGVGTVVGDRIVLTAGHVLRPEYLKDTEWPGLVYELTWRSGVTTKVAYADAAVRVVGAPGADVGILRVPSSPHAPGLRAAGPVVKVDRSDIPRYDGLIFSYHDPAGLQACKGDADDRSQEFLETGAWIEERDYKHGTDRERVRIAADLSPGYSGSPWLLAPCGSDPFCLIGVYVEDLSGESSGSVMEVVSDREVSSLLSDAGVVLHEYRGAERPPPYTVHLAGSFVVERYVAGPVLDRGFFGARLTGYFPLAGFGRRHRPAIGFVGGATYHFSPTVTVVEPVASPVDGDLKLSNERRSVDGGFGLDGGVYVESAQWLNVFWRGEAGYVYALHSYEDQRGTAGSSHASGGKLRLAFSLPVWRRLMFDVGVAGSLVSIEQHRFALTSIPGSVKDESSPTYAVSASLDLGLRLLPGDAL